MTQPRTVADYYGARWASYFNTLIAGVANGTAPDWPAWDAAELLFEQAWSVNTTMYPTTPSGVAPLVVVSAPM